MFAATFETQGGLHSYGWASSFLSLAITAQWNPKHPSLVSTQLFCNAISHLCCGEQTI